MIPGLVLTPLLQVPHPKGDILRALRATDPGFLGFAEAYFTTIVDREIKGWKKHTKMTMNLMVPQGEIKFVFCDGRAESPTYKSFQEVRLSRHNYQRICVPPGIWTAFQGQSSDVNLALNIANIEHDPNEAVNVPLEDIPYDWNKS